MNQTGSCRFIRTAGCLLARLVLLGVLASVVVACSDAGGDMPGAQQSASPVVAGKDEAANNARDNHRTSASWSLVSTTSIGDAYLLYGDGSYAWTSDDCVQRLAALGIAPTRVQWQQLSELDQRNGFANCDAIQSAFAGRSAVWSIVTTDESGQGFVRFGDGQHQWLGATCISRLRAYGVAVTPVPASQLRDLSLVDNLVSCSDVVNAASTTRTTGAATTQRASCNLLPADMVEPWRLGWQNRTAGVGARIDPSRGALRFSGTFTDAAAAANFVGINFINDLGIKIDALASDLAQVTLGDTASGAGTFEMTAMPPPGASTVWVWVHSEAGLTIDELSLRNTRCRR